MSELSPDARRLLQALDTGEATADDEARVRAALERSLGVTLAAAAVAASAPAAASALAGAQAATAAPSMGAMGGAVGAKAGASASLAGTAGSATAGASSSLLAVGLAGALAVAAGAGATVAIMATTASTTPSGYAASPPRRADLPLAPPPRIEAEPAVVPGEPVKESAADEGLGIDLRVEEGGRPGASEGRPQVPTSAQQRRPSTAPRESSAPEPELVSAAPDVEPAPAAADAPTVPSTCDRSAEVSFLDSADQALERGQPALAIARLEGFYAACPTGVWDRRAWMTRVSALCASGDLSKAASLIEWYVVEYAPGPELQRIARWCPPSLMPKPR